jgi:hypothetical protein
VTATSSAAARRPVTGEPSRGTALTSRPTLRRQCRGSVSGRSTPGEETSRTYGGAEQRRVVLVDPVQHVADRPRDVGDVVERDPAVLVDDDPHDAAPAGRGDGQGLEVVADGRDLGSDQLAQASGGGSHGVPASLQLWSVPVRAACRSSLPAGRGWLVPMGRGVDRRSVLLGTALLTAAACSVDPSPPPPPPPPDPDEALRSAAVERERALLARYDAFSATQPALAARLTSVREEHAEHLRVLLGPDEGPTAAPSDGPPSAPPTAEPADPVAPPAEPAAALAELVGAEAVTGAAHAAAALQAGGELAGLLASLAASEASHRVVLG